jgi:mannose-6-phosphate isomerase-like protein (cupin superfamily)
VGKEGEIGVLSRNEGIMLPKGTYYKFESCGDAPLVLLRVGAAKEQPKVRRINSQGNSLAGDSIENKHQEGIPIEERFYE